MQTLYCALVSSAFSYGHCSAMWFMIVLLPILHDAVPYFVCFSISVCARYPRQASPWAAASRPRESFSSRFFLSSVGSNGSGLFADELRKPTILQHVWVSYGQEESQLQPMPSFLTLRRQTCLPCYKQTACCKCLRTDGQTHPLYRGILLDCMCICLRSGWV